MRGLWLSVIVSTLFFPNLTKGAGVSSTEWTHFGTRPLAMGNAFVSISDDYNALFYNPAGLARIKTWDGEFLNPALHISSATTGLIQETRQLLGKTSTSKMIETIEKNTGKNQYLNLKLTPHLIIPNFGFALGSSLTSGFAWHRSLAVDVNATFSVVTPISFAFSILDDKLSFGFTTKMRAITSLVDRFDANDISAFSRVKKPEEGSEQTERTLGDYIKAGVGVGADVGLLFTPTKVLKPSLGISVTDVGGTAFKKVSALDAYSSVAPLIRPSVNVGISMRPLEIDSLYLTTALDIHSINRDYAFNKKLHAGIEIGYGSWAKIQTGLHQGYLTGGMVLDIGILNINLATYSVELSNYAGYREQRRYVAQFKLLL